MGRRRANGDPLGLAGTRIYVRRGRFYFQPRGATGERLLDTTDVEVAKRMARELDTAGDAEFGTFDYWMPLFFEDCDARVKAKQLKQRTLDDYRGYWERTTKARGQEPGPLKIVFGRMRPERVQPHEVQSYLDANAAMDPPRITQANRERALLSACFSWLLRRGKVPGLKVNPCLRGSGVKRNREKPRERYVTDEEYAAVYAAGNRKVRLAMELVYRTLQRPEVDLLAWTPANVVTVGGQQVLRFRQSKTGTLLTIELTGLLGELVREAVGEVPVLRQPILHTQDGGAYTYDGLMAMVKQAQQRVREQHRATGGPLADMPSFGLRDLKGKGATDMWLAGEPIERIQLLCGHKSKTTTEVYVKQRWSAAVAPNNRRVG